MQANVSALGGESTVHGVSFHQKISHGVVALRPYEEVQVMSLVQRFGLPRRGLKEIVNDWRAENAKHLNRGLKGLRQAYKHRLPHFFGALYLHFLPAVKEDDERYDIFFGLASLRVVTTAGVDFIVDAFQNTVEVELLKFHAIGTGTTAAVAGDTALVTEWTSAEYAARATGTTTEGASANIYRTVGTNTKLNVGTSAVTEHGVFSSATIGAGTLLDRSVFSAINLSQNDSLQSQYDATFDSGG